MLSILNIPQNLKEVKLYKVMYVILMIFLFSIIYTFFDNEEFAGWIEMSNNRLPYSQFYKLRRDVFSKYAQKYKNFMTYNEFLSIPLIKANEELHVIQQPTNKSKQYNYIKNLLFHIYSRNNKISFDTFTEIPMQFDLYPYTGKELDRAITYSNKYSVLDYFDRLYYSTIVQTTIGFGDVFPATKKLRFFTMVQAFSTLFILLL